MKKVFSFVSMAMMAVATFAQVSYDVIPLPRSIQLSPKGEVFTLSQGAVITYVSDNEQMASNARLLAEFLKTDAGFEVIPQADVRRSTKKNAPLGAASECRSLPDYGG